MASTYLGVSTTSSGTRTKWTISFWVKRSNLSNNNIIFGSYLDSSNNDVIRFNNVTGELQFWSYQSGSFSNGGYLKTNRLFRDTNAWYHIVCRWDSNNSTADDRMKIWVNGVEETSFSSRTNPTSGRESLINYQGYTTIGRLGSDYLSGVLSHVHFCDNQLYQPSDFGETDTNGVWKIKTSPSVSYGTTGYFALKDGNSLTDQSGLGNNLTVQGGTLTNTEDNPSNVFSTWNSLLSYGSTMSLANGNTTANTSSSHEASKFLSFYNSLGMTTGKYYAEFKITSNANQSLIGISSNFGDDVLGSTSSAYNFIYKGNGWGYYGSNGNVFHTNSDTQLSYGNSLANNDILGVALDLDNLKLYFSKNGVWQNSANPVTGSGDVVSAGAKALNGSGSTGTYFFSCADFDQGAVCNVQANFGNGYFGTTAVASAGTNASGNGIFEFDVPTGFTALSTKGLNL